LWLRQCCLTIDQRCADRFFKLDKRGVSFAPGGAAHRPTAWVTLDREGGAALDDRAGNVLTTVALLVVAAAIVYVARGAFFILLLSIQLAYLLDPAVTWVQQHAWLAKKNRAWAIAQVYLVGAIVIGSVG
jgi:hypothetical protein